MLFTLIIFGLMSAISGYLSYTYLNFYPKAIAKQIWKNFTTLYPDLLPQTNHGISFNIPQYFYSSQRFCVTSFIIISIIITFLTQHIYQNLMVTLYFNIYFETLWLLCLFDLRYRLIPIELCYFLFFLGINAVIYHVIDLSLISSLYHAIIGFSTFYIISLIAKCIYKEEALGIGDCWLMLGLCSSLSLIQIPWLILIASLLGITYVLLARYWQKNIIQIPFVPFLAVSQTLLLLQSVLY
ncbi:hypothetical protein A6A19_06080 [Actinobacillus delphinicola]|uniref:A24 family peptidase n=1 Tax=Actinobacillus delphinicola TaxID=51161 RepID=UPI0024421875|nr:A24 family peptidase [Actinobacillus delphinicola]MDG6897560.1 hypothetical protein [Actinobacillus delphinicola]